MNYRYANSFLKMCCPELVNRLFKLHHCYSRLVTQLFKLLSRNPAKLPSLCRISGMRCVLCLLGWGFNCFVLTHKCYVTRCYITELTSINFNPQMSSLPICATSLTSPQLIHFTPYIPCTDTFVWLAGRFLCCITWRAMQPTCA